MEHKVIIKNPSEKLLSLVKKLRDLKVAQRMEMKQSSVSSISVAL